LISFQVLAVTMMNNRMYQIFSVVWLLRSVAGFSVSPSTTPRVNVALSMAQSEHVEMGDVGFVLLAGGTGSRMKANMPKQFLPLRGVPVLHYSLDLFLERLPAFAKEQGIRYVESASQSNHQTIPIVSTIYHPFSGPPFVVLVMDPKYQPEYQPIVDKYNGRLTFANPGIERQGSVQNGLSKLCQIAGGTCQYIAVHDSARPLVTIEEISNVIRDAKEYGAAVLGVPCKATIKESHDGSTVLRTIPRSRLWEVHTPQVIKIDTLQRGFIKVEEDGSDVTDDVSIVEGLGEPVKLTRGEYTNLKITTPEDMDVANAILEERKAVPVDMLA
jgi:2-C-methyl-D-erythritol 4-phosphate cytidylyltransferase